MPTGAKTSSSTKSSYMRPVTSSMIQAAKAPAQTPATGSLTQKAYTTSWTIAVPMSRGSDPDAEILEFGCIEGNTDQLHYPGNR